jgi:low temperature requirement protein LtrA
MPASLLRSRTGSHHGRVGFIELFFDLVFVFAVTQISHLLLAHPDLEHALQSAFLLLALWIVWIYTTWATNWLDCEQDATRLMMFGLMAAGLVLAAAIPDAFGERGLYFAVAYTLAQNVRNLFLLAALERGKSNERRNFQRIQLWLLTSGAFWIAGGLSDGPTRWALWSVALLCEFASPWIGFWVPGMGRSSTQDWGVDPDHIAERAGLFIIIALGESVILIGATFAIADRWDAAHLGALAGAYLGAAAMWWMYFANIAEEAHEAFARHDDPGRLARVAYTYAHIPMVAGIVLSAVGNEMLLAHPTGHIDAVTTSILIGGPALFVAGSFWFYWLFCAKPPLSHIAGLAALGALAFAAPSVEPVWLGAATTFVLVGIGAWESLAPGPSHVSSQEHG